MPRGLWVTPFLALLLVLPATCRPQPREVAQPAATGPSQPVTDVIVTADGTVWASYGDLSFHPRGGGILRSQNGQLTHFSTKNELPGDTIQQLALSPGDEVWAASGCQVLRFRGNQWQTLSEACSDHLPGTITDFAFSPDGSVWIATGFELVRYSGGSWSRERILANSLAVDKQGGLMVAGWRGRQDTFFVQIHQEDGQRFLEQPSNPIVHLFDDGNGRVWGRTQADDLYYFDDGGWQLEVSGHHRPNDFGTLSALIAGPDHSLWMVHRLGLLVYRKGRWCLDPYLAHVYPTALTLQKQSASSIWIGTRSGRLLSYGTVCGIHPGGE